MLKDTPAKLKTDVGIGLLFLCNKTEFVKNCITFIIAKQLSL